MRLLNTFHFPWIARNSVLLGLVILTASIFWFLGPKLDSSFSLVDEGDIVVFNHSGNLIGTVSEEITRDWNMGRFRPLYWFGMRSMTLVLHANSTLWHWYSLGVFILCVLLFYRWLVAVTEDNKAAILGTTSTFFVAATLYTFIRLSPGEIYGTLFLLSAMGIKIRRPEELFWSSLFMIAAFLCKETFVLFLGIVLIPYLKRSTQIKDLFSLPVYHVALITALGMSILLLLKLSVGSDSYGFVTLETNPLETFGIVVDGVFSHFYVWIALPMLAWAVFTKRFAWVPFAILVLIAASQIGLYVNRGSMQAHYFYPLVLSIGTLVALGMKHLFDTLPEGVSAVIFLSFLTVGLFQNRLAPYNAAFYHAETHQHTIALDKLAQLSPTDTLVLAHPNVSSLGRTEAIRILLEIQGSTPVIVDYLVSSVGIPPRGDAYFLPRSEEVFPDAYKTFASKVKMKPETIRVSRSYFHLSSLSFRKAVSTSYIYHP